MLDADECWDRLRTRDARFDGTFYVGVTSTGVYCRPVCPARTPARERCRFFGDAAAAEAEGFRACRRCRPERAPGHAPVDAPARWLRRALARIEAGALDSGTVAELAAALGVSERHLRRVFVDGIGVSPHAWGASRRLALARQLAAVPGLSRAQIARAAGFGSERRLRAVLGPTGPRGPSEGDVALGARLDARPPFDAAPGLAFVGARAVAGVEVVEAGAWRRVVRLGARVGIVEARPAGRGVEVRVSSALGPALPQILARVRRAFDLDARPDLVDGSLGADPLLAPLVAARPGLRLPAAFEPFELAVRAVVGQQVTVRAATTLCGRVAAAFGDPVALGDPVLDRVFPGPERLAGVDPDAIAALGMPRRRAQTVVAVARAVAEERVDLSEGTDPLEVERALLALPGIGPWTASYVVMRGLAFPDAFPAGDLGLRRALGCGERAAAERAAAWRPWRSYAALHLWSSGGAT